MRDRTIYLIRHGRLQVPDDEKRYIGQIDIPLNETGISQAVRLRERLAGEKLESIFSSDLARTRETAKIIAARRNIIITELKQLREISLGEWEGRTFTEIERNYPEAFKARGKDIVNYKARGGESFAECNTRVIGAFIEIVRSTTGNIVISGHAGVNRLILCFCMGEPLSNMFSIRQDYGCLNIIHQSTGYEIVAVNDSPDQKTLRSAS